MTDITVVYTSLDSYAVELIEKGLREMFSDRHNFLFTNERERVPQTGRLIVVAFVHHDSTLNDYDAISAGIPNFEEIYYRPNTLYVVLRGSPPSPHLFELRNLDYFYYSEVVSLFWNVGNKNAVFAHLEGFWHGKVLITKFLKKPLDPLTHRVRFREDRTRPRDDSPQRTTQAVVYTQPQTPPSDPDEPSLLSRRIEDIETERRVLIARLAVLSREKADTQLKLDNHFS
jgi:hypothetical protein